MVRALPPVVSQLLFRYLAFVRPFAEALSHQVNQLGSGKPESVPYIFATPSGAPFQTSQMTAALKKHSERTCSATLTVASYRQTVLAIAKQYIVPMAHPFDARKPEQISQIWQDIAWQAAHHVRTLTGSYALDRSFPTQLQPELIGRYLALSALWHCWLQLERLEEKQKQMQQRQLQLKPVAQPAVQLEPAAQPEPTAQPAAQLERCSPPEVLQEDWTLPEVVQEDCNLPEVLQEDCNLPEVPQEDCNLPEVLQERCNPPEVLRERSLSLEVIGSRCNTPEPILGKRKGHSTPQNPPKRVREVSVDSSEDEVWSTPMQAKWSTPLTSPAEKEAEKENRTPLWSPVPPRTYTPIQLDFDELYKNPWV